MCGRVLRPATGVLADSGAVATLLSVPEAAGAAKGPYERWDEVVLPLLLYSGQHESGL